MVVFFLQCTNLADVWLCNPLPQQACFYIPPYLLNVCISVFVWFSTFMICTALQPNTHVHPRGTYFTSGVDGLEVSTLTEMRDQGFKSPS